MERKERKGHKCVTTIEFDFLNYLPTLFFRIGDVTINHEAKAKNSNLYRYIEAFRKHGHKCSKINPVPVRTPLR